MNESSLLIADIGGTNARFALAHHEGPGFTSEISLRCDDYRTPEHAARSYLKDVGARAPDVICLATAGPVHNGTVNFTNNHWQLNESGLAAAFGISAVRVINDFESIAMSLPLLELHDLIRIGSPNLSLLEDDGCVGILGAGTGLGAAGLVKRGGVAVPLVTEAGHAGFAPMSQLQAEIHGILSKRFGRVSNERLISGQGLENIYGALGLLNNQATQDSQAADIFLHAAAGTDDLAAQTVDLFFEILGQVAGDFVMSIGGYDGLYLAGGILQRYSYLIAQSKFRISFENKGRLSGQLRATPSMVISHKQPGLLGASEFARLMSKDMQNR